MPGHRRGPGGPGMGGPGFGGIGGGHHHHHGPPPPSPPRHHHHHHHHEPPPPPPPPFMHHHHHGPPPPPPPRHHHHRHRRRGCYIATCVYGSYDCPQVWTLRRFRDRTLEQTFLGRLFIDAYYAVSPALVKIFGGSKLFRGICRKLLDPMVDRLRKKGVKDTPYKDRF